MKNKNNIIKYDYIELENKMKLNLICPECDSIKFRIIQVDTVFPTKDEVVQGYKIKFNNEIEIVRKDSNYKNTSHVLISLLCMHCHNIINILIEDD